MKIITILAFYLGSLISIYSFSIYDTQGNTISFSNFSGKKILIVNTATNSPDSSQYASMEQLCQKYKDSLIVIAVPSNDFGNEQGNDTAIQNFVTTNYNIHYLLAAKAVVSGSNISPLYDWLADINKNGMMNSAVKKDFTKYLINSEGRLIGVFASTVDPMDTLIQDAIKN